MATVAQIISDFRFDTSCDLQDSEILGILNRSCRDIYNDIRSINENYFYNYWLGDTLIGEEEFTMLQTGDIIELVPQEGMVDVKAIGIKYKGDTQFRKMRLDTIDNLPYDLSWYKDNQSKGDPFFLIQDRSIFVYPAPDDDITDGIIFYGIGDPLDLSLIDVNIKIPFEYQHLILLWMKKYYYASRLMYDAKNDAINDLERDRVRMLRGLRRNIAPVTIQDNIYHNMY